jgi:hypothetical protein
VAQRLQQAADAPRTARTAEQDRNAEAFARLARKVLEDLLGRRRLIHQELLEKLVVMIGKLFEHLGTRLDFPVVEFRRNLDALGLLAGAIFECALERQIDEAADLLSIPDGNLAGYEGRHAHRLQCREQVADSAMRLVDSIDEDKVRDSQLVERSKGRSHEGGARRIRVDDDDRDIRDGHGAGSVSGEADRSWHVDDSELVAEIFEIVEVELGRAAA